MAMPTDTPLGPLGFAVAAGGRRAGGPVARRRGHHAMDIALVVLAFSFVAAVTLSSGLTTAPAVAPASTQSATAP